MSSYGIASSVIAKSIPKLVIISTKAVIHFAAINIHTEDAMRSCCSEMPTEEIKISTPYEGEIELVNLNFHARESDL